jgi:hypothetical protein
MQGADRTAWIDALIAAALACTLAAVWAWRDWANLSALQLPDADDMMRLQQIRDWLGGQGFADLSQHRLGAAGVPMHWSRLADLVPAGIIMWLQGLIGRHQSEVVAVIVWPAMLLTAAIALIGRIARLVGGADVARPAMIVAAMAYPASTLFLPGRIDHHGLQLVLLLVTIWMLIGRATIAAGAIAGVAMALSLVVGMELAPLLGVAAAVAVADWVIGRPGSRERLMGLGLALCAGTLTASIAFRSIAWDYPACDGFTAISARATVFAALVPIALALTGSTSSVRVRAALAATGAIALGATVVVAAPQCLSPYGGVDPMLQRLWLAHVAEAQPLFAAPPATAFAYGGLLAAGLVASLWFAWRTRERGWVVLALLQLGAGAVVLTQLRGAYAGALLAAPALGASIVAARRLSVLALTGAWVVSAGMSYPLAAQQLATPGPTSDGASCTAPDLIAALGKLPSGTVMAPIDTGAPAIASTEQRLIAGAYHRDGAGNLAMYDFYRGTPDHAHAIASRWRARWVVACDGFAGVAAPFALQLERGHAPIWLRDAARVPSGARIYEVTAAGYDTLGRGSASVRNGG